jgi:hypothetical protein
MGSTARRHGVSGGEYAPTGLHLFAWWKKNRTRGLQKPGSGSVQIRSNLKLAAHPSFYRRIVLHERLGHAHVHGRQSDRIDRVHACAAGPQATRQKAHRA